MFPKTSTLEQVSRITFDKKIQGMKKIKNILKFKLLQFTLTFRIIFREKIDLSGCQKIAEISIASY